MREGLRDTSKNLIRGYAAYDFLLKPHVNSIRSSLNAGKALLSGNFYEAGNIAGYQSAGVHLEAGLTLATLGRVRGVSGLFKTQGSRFSASGSNLFNGGKTFSQY